MTEPRAQRTLVKSPPELWAEISDPDALTRRLGELGEIRITRLDHESTVAWEGDRVCGTVEIEASGWGTKVTMTARRTAPEPVATVVEEEAAPVAAPARAAAPLAPVGRRPGLLAMFRRRPRGSTPAPPPTLAPRAMTPTPAPVPAPAPAPQNVTAVLEAALDDLGSASKRPFSR